MTYLVQGTENHVIHLDPDGALPVVLALSELGMRCGQTAEAVWRPEVLGVTQEVEDSAEVRRVGREELQ